MEIEVKQRNRRRKRAQRMQQQLKETKANKANHDESEAEDVIPKKPPRPPNRRKKQKDLLKEPLCEEDIVDGFAVLQFRSYEDLELVLKISIKENIKRLTDIERPKLEPKAHITNHILVHNNHGLTVLGHDPATSDDSGRASERLTGSSVAPRDADSSRDRLSDASSRCSSGKGYICDSEGEDDKIAIIVRSQENESQEDAAQEKESKEKEGHQETVDTPLTSPSDELPPQGSDASSVIFASAPSSRKHELPGALPPGGVPAAAAASPLPAPTPPHLPAPSPAPAQQPPHHPPPALPPAAAAVPPASAAAPPQTQHPIGPADNGGKQTVVPLAEQQAHAKHAAVHDAPIPPPQKPSLQPPPPIIIGQQPHPTLAVTAVPPSETGIAAVPTPVSHPGHHQSSLSSSNVVRTESLTVATTATTAPAQYHHPYPPLYAPYATSYPSNATPYSTAPYSSSATQYGSVMTTASSHHPTTAATVAEREKARVATPPTITSRTSTPSREKESYSNVSSLSRSSVPMAVPAHASGAPSVVSAPSSLNKPWPTPAPVSAAQQMSPAPVPRPAPAAPLHAPAPAAYVPGPAPPLFPAPAPPPPVSAASPLTAPPPQANPNPFSAESLFQTNQADMLRRELDNRFLASQDRSIGVAPPPYLRTEMHQHQHHHTHVHQHTTSLLPPPSASTIFPSQLPLSPMERLARRNQTSFKDIPKLGGVESPFYRQNIGMPNYPGYAPGLLSHHSLTTGPTPFVPPNHLPTFAPKPINPQDPTKPKIMKSGKWNAMHVRVAWEIYHHQQKSGEAKGSITATKAATDLLRPPTHLFSPSVHATRAPHDISPFPSMAGHRPPGFDQPHHPGSLFSTPGGHLGKSPFTNASSISPFTRYGGAALTSSSTSPFSVSPFAAARESHLGLGQMHHDPWRSLQRTMPGFPPAVNPLPPSLPGLPPPGPAPWAIKPDPVLEQREREAREREERERERLRREREERERREREEKQRRLEQQQQERERERREKERREMERREMEKREREREMMLHQQRLAESAKQLPPPVIRDRSPLRNGQIDLTEIRVKEEPRTKEEDLLSRTDHRYHPFLRHPGSLPPPPSVLDRTRVLQHALPPHYAPAGHWPPPHAADPFYRYGYGPLMDERTAGFFGAAYGHHPAAAQLRPKDPSLLHLRGGPGPPPPMMGHKMSATPPTDIHKKEEPR